MAANVRQIMWPRDEIAGGRHDKSIGYTGFVSFMLRKDAELALKESDGAMWNGSCIKTGWGKTVPLPIRPSFSAGIRKERGRDRSSSPLPRARSRSGSRGPRKSRRTTARSPSPRSKLQERLDAGSEQADLIRNVAQRVTQHGLRFEELIKTKEKDNPQFRFLQDEDVSATDAMQSQADAVTVP